MFDRCPVTGCNRELKPLPNNQVRCAFHNIVFNPDEPYKSVGALPSVDTEYSQVEKKKMAKVLEAGDDYGLLKDELPELKRFLGQKGSPKDYEYDDFLGADTETRKLLIDEFHRHKKGEKVFLLNED